MYAPSWSPLPSYLTLSYLIPSTSYQMSAEGFIQPCPSSHLADNDNEKQSDSEMLLFSREVLSDSLWPQGSQHTRLPYPSLCPRVCSSSCPLSRWCHPTISSSAILFFFCLQSFPASGSFPMSQRYYAVKNCAAESWSSIIMTMSLSLTVRMIITPFLGTPALHALLWECRYYIQFRE